MVSSPSKPASPPASQAMAPVESATTAHEDQPAAAASKPTTETTDVEARASHDESRCETCGEDKIKGYKDVLEAIKLAWVKQRRHLFVSWIQVPVGCCFILVVAWALNLAMDAAPFRFPGPVLGTIVFFALLLFLDWLSIKFPGKQPDADPEKGSQRPRQRKRFVEPVMALLGPPCDFLLRNMSCLFTPAFVLIPARESIPGKEIGLLVVWFLATQVLAYVLPVFFVRAVEWVWGAPKRTRQLRQRKEEQERRNSTITMPGLEWEKRRSYGGGDRLGPIATGLSGLTAVVVAPVSHVNMDRDETEQDQYRHIAGVELEVARQQGDPFMATFDSHKGYPRSDVSAFLHPSPHAHLHHLHHHHRSTSGSRVRSSSAPRSSSRRRPASAGRDRPGTAGSDAQRSERRGRSGRPGSSRPGTAPQDGPVPPPLLRNAVTFDEGFSFGRRQAPGQLSDGDPMARDVALDVAPDVAPDAGPSSPPPAALNAPRVAFMPRPLEVEDRDGIEVLQDNTAVNTRRNSPDLAIPPTAILTNKSDASGMTLSSNEKAGQTSTGEQVLPAAASKKVNDADQGASDDNDEDDEDEDDDASSSSSTYGPDAIERLADWIGDLITPTAYFILFIVGLPLWFLYDFALALHLAINILTFWLAITVVPAKIRRYAHPILTTAIATVLLIWAFGEMRGQSLKQTLTYYDRDAKFDELWRPSPRYTGPVPGAADVLSSLLDAGIVALFVPLYRYRKDLKECGTRMFVALLPCVGLSLFFWPTIAALIGLDQSRALAFAARFLSTPLAIELIETLRGDESMTVILVVITGIVAAVLKEPFFKLMRVDMDEDYLIVGVTFGATSGAIGASSLIARPRVMAVASLAFVMFGAMCLIAVAIPPIVEAVRTLASL